MKLAALVLAVPLAFALGQDSPAPDPVSAEVTAHHRWLQRLVGEWTVVNRPVPAPGAEPTEFELEESVRSLGELWVVAEGRAEFAGQPFQSMMTLGYDPESKAFVGTWVASMQAHLWTYEGRYDEATDALTLEAEGPTGTPGETARYRDRIQWEGPDKRTLVSSMLLEDGTWSVFSRSVYTRKP